MSRLPVNLMKAVVKASDLLQSAVETANPDADKNLLDEGIAELVSFVVSGEKSDALEASSETPEVNVAADMLALAHSMFMSGDKQNALQITIEAFNSPDCEALMTALASLNEEADKAASESGAPEVTADSSGSSEVDDAAEDDDDIDPDDGALIDKVLSALSLGNTDTYDSDEVMGDDEIKPDAVTSPQDIGDEDDMEEDAGKSLRGGTTSTNDELGEDNKDESLVRNNLDSNVIAASNKVSMSGSKKDLIKAKNLIESIVKYQRKAA